MFPADQFLVTGPRDQTAATLILAHGAGAPMDHEFMNRIASGLADENVRVVRFEFPYMARRRITGKSRPPDSANVLQQTWRDVITRFAESPLLIGGKSMGGRIASMVADEASPVAGVACLGYPFHPVGKPDRLRIGHLAGIKTPVLVVQGDRDPFGNQHEVTGYRLGRQVRIHWLADGDHSFEPRKASGRTLQQNLAEAVRAVAGFVRDCLSD